MQSDEFVTLHDVEVEMAELSTRIESTPGVIKEHHNRLKEARWAYKKAWAIAYSMADGSQALRKVQADLETEEEADAMAVAEVEYQFVRDSLDALKTKLRALQSIGSMMRAEMFSPQGGI